MTVATHRYVEHQYQRFVVLSFTVQPATDIKGFLALCPALGVATEGETPREAENNIREAVGLYLTAIDDDGELDRVFAQKGLTVSYLEPGSKGSTDPCAHRQLRA
ncbi:MAG TPA: type II toxin-antitoxin system HicB family antitoxin, partial [Chloroflexota bacterium]